MKKAKKVAAKKPVAPEQTVWMTPEELRSILDTKLKISQEGFGRLIGVMGRTVRAWLAGDNAVPKVVAILVRLMLKTKTAPGDL